MINKNEFFELLRRNISFESTHNAVEQLSDDIEWSDEDVITLCDIAITCDQVYGTLSYKRKTGVRDFFRKILRNYNGLPNENINRVAEIVFILDNAQIYTFLINEKQRIKNWHDYANSTWHNEEYDMDISICDGLYHANSVSTAVSYIRHKMIYSRAYGDEHFSEEQTSQRSDESDVRAGVYNDLFFDNCDIRSVTGRHSAYGPITFVFDESILNNPNFNIRITKINPWNVPNFGALDVKDRFFTSIEELYEEANTSQYPFRTNFGHHTTIWNTSRMVISSASLKYILVELNVDEEMSIRVKNLLLEELAQANYQNIPVIIRQTVGRLDNINTAAPPDELWCLPQ